MKKITIVIFMLVSSTYAKFPTENRDNLSQSDTQSNKTTFERDYPYDKRLNLIPPSVQRQRFIMNLDKEAVKKSRVDTERSKNILDGTLDIAVLQKPIHKALKTIDTLYIHSNYITTIMFPKEFTIKTAGVSFSTTTFTHAGNVLLLQPSKNSSNGNIVFSLYDGKKNYMMNIFIKQYFKEDECKISGGRYKCVGDYLATIIKYTKPEPLTTNFKLNLIEDYLKLNNLKKLKIAKNLAHLDIQKNGETYYIIRDDEFGTICNSNITLRIEKTLN